MGSKKNFFQELKKDELTAPDEFLLIKKKFKKKPIPNKIPGKRVAV